jgi:hypothetical protein
MKKPVKTEMKTETIIEKYGYEYHLVFIGNREPPAPQPEFMGKKGFALKSVNKKV